MSLDRSSNSAAFSDPRADLIRDLCQYCDLAERLPLLPPSVKSRGVYLVGIDRVLAKSSSFDKFKALFPQRPSAIPWYPTREFLVRCAVAGAMLAGPERVHQGMFEIGRGNAVTFAESLLGRALIRLLDRDPKRLLKQGIAGRRQGNTHGHWELEFPSEREAVVTMTEEYCYIESYMLGAAQGTFDAIGMPVRAEAVLQDRFNGKHVLRW
jgi:uncharacterized protein (TIGR02265 family)